MSNLQRNFLLTFVSFYIIATSKLSDAHISLIKSNYVWVHGPFSECSVTCGVGNEASEPVCRNSMTGARMREALCSSSTRPQVLVRKCQINPDCSAKWIVGDWTNCSSVCGGGNRYRKAYCGQPTSVGFFLKTADSLCPGKKPSDSETCNTFECPRWREGVWSSCSVTCGVGIRRRNVECDPVKSVRCLLEAKPPTTQNCFEKPCPDLYRPNNGDRQELREKTVKPTTTTRSVLLQHQLQAPHAFYKKQIIYDQHDKLLFEVPPSATTADWFDRISTVTAVTSEEGSGSVEDIRDKFISSGESSFEMKNRVELTWDGESLNREDEEENSTTIEPDIVENVIPIVDVENRQISDDIDNDTYSGERSLDETKRVEVTWDGESLNRETVGGEEKEQVETRSEQNLDDDGEDVDAGSDDDLSTTTTTIDEPASLDSLKDTHNLVDVATTMPSTTTPLWRNYDRWQTSVSTKRRKIGPSADTDFPQPTASTIPVDEESGSGEISPIEFDETIIPQISTHDTPSIFVTTEGRKTPPSIHVTQHPFSSALTTKELKEDRRIEKITSSTPHPRSTQLVSPEEQKWNRLYASWSVSEDEIDHFALFHLSEETMADVTTARVSANLYLRPNSSINVYCLCDECLATDWFKKGKPISTKVLRLRSVSAKDAGEYECRRWENEPGTASKLYVNLLGIKEVQEILVLRKGMNGMLDMSVFVDRVVEPKIIAKNPHLQLVQIDGAIQGYGCMKKMCGRMQTPSCELLANNMLVQFNQSHCNQGNNQVARCDRESCYRWKTDKWRECYESPCVDHLVSRTQRQAKCVDADLKTVAETACLSKQKPETEKMCDNPDCFARWKTTNWTRCSESCGVKGVKKKKVPTATLR